MAKEPKPDFVPAMAGDPADYANLVSVAPGMWRIDNPTQTQLYQQLFGGGANFGGEGTLYNQLLAGMTASLPDMQGGDAGMSRMLTQQALAGYDPQGFMKQFLSYAPALQALAYGGPMGEAYGQLGDQLSRKAIQDVASSFSGDNALYSGAAMSAMAEGAMTPKAQLAAQLASQQYGLLGNLYGGAMGGLERSNVSGFEGTLQAAGLYSNLAQSQLQAALQQQSNYASAFGSLLPMAAQLTEPTYFQPDLVENPRKMRNWFGGGGGENAMSLANLAMMLMTF